MRVTIHCKHQIRSDLIYGSADDPIRPGVDLSDILDDGPLVAECFMAALLAK